MRIRSNLIKKDVYKMMNMKIAEVIKSILRITGLTLVIVVISLSILYVRFGPEAEVDPTFPREPKGEFTQFPTVTTADGSIIAHWIVPSACNINEIEFQEMDPVDKKSWFGGTAICAQGAGFRCEVDLTNRDLSLGVTYRLQAHHDQCTVGGSYVSTVTTFSL